MREDVDPLAAGWRLLQQGDRAAALRALERACAGQPENAAAHFTHAACLHALGSPAAALAAFERALALEPDHRDAALGSIAVLCELGRAAEAMPRALALAERDPRDAALRFTAGHVQELAGDAAAAIAAYDAALGLDPAFRPAFLNRGRLLTRLGRLDEAYANNVAAAHAHAREPDSHFNLAEVALAQSRYETALEHCAQALALAPDHVGALFDGALALAALGRLDEAQASLSRARSIDAAAVRALETRVGGTVATALDPRDVYVVRGFEALNRCDWTRRTEYLERFATLVGTLADAPLAEQSVAFHAMASGLPPERQRLAAEAASLRFARGIAPLGGVAARLRQRLRIGYLSPDFRDHPVGFLVQSLIERHDRTRFEIFAFGLHRGDGGTVARRIAAGADAFVDLADAGDLRAAKLIRGHAIDVLVDLAGHTDGSRPALLARRPAPVIVSWLGFPGTTGAQYVDYFVGDPVVAPPGTDAQYTEQLIRLPHTFWVHDRPADSVPPAREALGLPQEAVVLCAFHNAYKLAPTSFDAWCAALARAPEAVLWLLDGGPAFRANVAREAIARGIAPHRLHFAPRASRAANLARLGCADLFVDAFHYNAGANALDALWAGLPVLTCPGASFAARMCASALLAASMPELVAATPASYAARLQALVADPAERTRLRGRLRAARDAAPLFDVDARARELERACAAAFARACEGLAPSAFALDG